MNYRKIAGCLLFCCLCLISVQYSWTADFTNPPRIDEFLGEQGMTRAGRDFPILAVVSNPSEEAVEFRLELELPDGVKIVSSAVDSVSLAAGEKTTLRWTVTADRPLYEEIVLKIIVEDNLVAVGRLPVRFLEPREISGGGQIPEPVRKSDSRILVGIHNCPLWSGGNFNMWSQLKKHPERTPALGFYAQENPEVADWETKWAVEHGVDFFIYCWYRDGQGCPVKQNHGSAIHEALFNSRFQNDIKFTIMWENQVKGKAGVSDEADLMETLFPWWMENYFKRDNYLKVDNKPVLFIYRPEFLINDLGSDENVRQAMDKMREACKKEGFDGMYILGEYRGTDPNHLQMMKNLGLDYTFAYCWPVSNSPSPAEAIKAQKQKILETDSIGIIPQVLTVSQAWSGWKDEGSIWKLPPDEFETLLRWAKAYIEKMPSEQLGNRMLILDNWNEWGEGHYLLPYTEYGFGYLDAIRNVFSDLPKEHVDLIPEDVGMGPYDTIYRNWQEEQRR
ncbi:MAG: glycoside hydrolase family 99-like domain-containing protein [Thermoguttaceae bacterium]|nr:glycoside hydrolase family 99-like domain-containing protein [Thermoguttaceae bacterium]